MQQRRSHAIQIMSLGVPAPAYKFVQGTLDDPSCRCVSAIFSPVALAPAVALVWVPGPVVPVPLPPPVGWAASGFTPSGLA